MRTADQSTSSSSAISIGIEVLIPCPISGRLEAMVTAPSGAMRTKALNGLAATSPCARTRPGRLNDSSRPPPAAAPVLRNSRREGFSRIASMLTPPPGQRPP